MKSAAAFSSSFNIQGIEALQDSGGTIACGYGNRDARLVRRTRLAVDDGLRGECTRRPRDDHHTRSLQQSQRGAPRLPIIAIAMGDHRLTTFIAMTLLAAVAFASCSLGSGDGA